jgi:glutathione S-transferase
MLRLWGRQSSINVQKVLWCLAELELKEGIDFERIDAGLEFGVNRSPEYLNMNPNGLVPTLEDSKLVLWESNTIMRYLVRTYDTKHRFSTDIAAQYQSSKWLDWQLSTMWPPLRVTFLGLTRTPEAKRNYEAIKKGYQDTNTHLAMLDETLGKQSFCSGDQFHIGDIPLGLCVNRWTLLHQAFPEKTGPKADLIHIDQWLKRLEDQTHYSEIVEKELNVVKLD